MKRLHCLLVLGFRCGSRLGILLLGLTYGPFIVRLGFGQRLGLPGFQFGDAGAVLLLGLADGLVVLGLGCGQRGIPFRLGLGQLLVFLLLRPLQVATMPETEVSDCCDERAGVTLNSLNEFTLGGHKILHSKLKAVTRQ